MNDEVLQTLINVIKADNLSGMSQRVIGDKKDVVTVGDLAVGDFIIKSLLGSGARVLIESEEHGKQQNFGDGEQEEYYVAIDDIDGSNNLRVGNGILPYCSMVVVFRNDAHKDYTYQDIVCAACLEHVSKKIFYTEKGMGEVCIFNENGEKVGSSKENNQNNLGLAQTLSTDVVSSTRGGAKGYEASESVKPQILPSVLDSVYKKYAIVDSGCSVFEYAMIGSGIRNGYVSLGKKQHELPLLYAFCKETGKKMVDFNGVGYDDRVYEFSGKDASVIAGDDKIVSDCLSLIKRQQLVNKRISEILSEKLQEIDSIEER